MYTNLKCVKIKVDENKRRLWLYTSCSRLLEELTNEEL